MPPEPNAPELDRCPYCAERDTTNRLLEQRLQQTQAKLDTLAGAVKTYLAMQDVDTVHLRRTLKAVGYGLPDVP